MVSGALKDQTEAVIGAAFEVANTLGHGLLEKPYGQALVIELGLRGIPVRQQVHYPVMYKGISVGDYIPDIIAYDAIVVEVKVVDRIDDVCLGQALNYLAITHLTVGLILNFKRPRLDWKRVSR